ncbi:MAG: uroporphyrinogen-III C-methyltransferase [Deltaproteobacteria bacterium]|jgi:uroporphyrinogen III methyltransferase/synthase|nr:uroporphyrinogen-III C-methyltransferase [Deltaproteobacteria bacterium]
MAGIVYLVGAGPGDPGLLTLRGAELLRRADVVVYDHLAFPGLLDMVRPDARIIYVGKEGADHTLSQEAINDLLVREGAAGNSVVRLKGGDPYIFGRGGEEALRLAERGVAFEVVPGVSSTCAAAAYAGIPLTHRDLSSQAVLITGHERPDREDSAHSWKALAAIGTLVAVMGRERLPEICRALLEAGKDPATPAALVEWGTTDRQRTAAATLSDLPSLADSLGIRPPALFVCGKVVGLRERLAWFERRPLWGRTVSVTRTRSQAGRLSAALRELGARVEERPVIRIEEIDPNPELDRALAGLSRFAWVAFTSPNGAGIFMRALFARGLDARALAGARIAVIGPGTAEALRPWGLVPDLVPRSFVAEGLLEAFRGAEPGPLLLARARKARDVLPEGLASLGFAVELCPLYETGHPSPDPAWDPASSDLTTITSASCAEGLAALVPEGDRARVRTASIGPVASSRARELGFTVAVESPAASIPALVGAMEAYFRAGPAPGGA